MAAVAAKGLTYPVVQYLVGGICTSLVPKIHIKLPARTASHELVKKAIIHGSLSNIARSRKKKSRDVDMYGSGREKNVQRFSKRGTRMKRCC